MELLLQNRQLLTVLFDGCVRRKRFIAHHVIDIESLHTWLLSSTTQLWQTFHTVKISFGNLVTYQGISSARIVQELGFSFSCLIVCLFLVVVVVFFYIFDNFVSVLNTS